VAKSRRDKAEDQYEDGDGLSEPELEPLDA
jgi:hypothetical protein